MRAPFSGQTPPGVDPSFPGGLAKYSDDQPRDESGRFTSAGGGSVSVDSVGNVAYNDQKIGRIANMEGGKFAGQYGGSVVTRTTDTKQEAASELVRHHEAVLATRSSLAPGQTMSATAPGMVFSRGSRTSDT